MFRDCKDCARSNFGETAYLKTWNITRESSMGNRKVTRFRRLTTVNQQRDGARAEVQLETGSPGFYGRL
ncbi:uncharacterized protein LOC114874076 isoform X2 [Osmia bicornis bicornis]|uniref:uncharacterized protein LOC114874076 isoform X2 n=1 Tax=Osmia bicornis bicornis TaxID=1437191 RepID=UPI001EAEA206|nr:uncharacterized protein LOC114874076 isoform X2 [Osmia bicornis bicornis]